MTSSEYWAERFRQLTETQTLADEELIKELENLYKQAQTEIESKIARWYMKFAENNEISMYEAKKLLRADELDEFRWTVEEYIKHGEENIDDVFTKQLVNASSKVHISRYEALLTELRQTAEKIMGTQASKLTEHLKTAYSENYLHTAFEIQKGTGVGTYLGGVDERSLEQVVRKSWAVDGNNFSERIWKDRNSLVSEIDTQLKRNIALGKGPDEAVTAISKRFETSKSNAYRLVMTESAAISAKATKQCYDDLEVEEFEVLETLDAHTCEICGAMDGKHFPKSQYEIGVTVPPFHPRCRGTTVPYFDDMEGYGERAARDLDGSTFYVPADTTYEQWKQIQDDKYGAGSVDKARKMEYNKSTDLKQYEQYKKVLGTDILGSENEFRRLKYFDTVKYEDIQGFYLYKKRVPEASENDYSRYKKVKEIGVKGIIQIPPKTIKTDELELNDDHALRHGCTLDDAKDFVTKAQLSISRKRWDGEHTNFYSFDGAAYIEDDTYKVKTVFSKDDFDERTRKIMEVFK